MPRGDVLARRFAIFPLVVEENVRAERLDEFTLVLAAEEQHLVDADAQSEITLTR